MTMETISPPPHLSLVDFVVETVTDHIASGDLKPGSRITEQELSRLTNVSRTPVREAVKRLSEAGLITVTPRCGLTITPMDEKDLAEITELREELESFALRLAVENISEQALARLSSMQKECEHICKTGDRLDIFKADGRFHLELAALSGNRYLLDVLQKLERKVHLCRMLFCRSESKIASNVRFHRKIIAALKRADKKQAEKIIRSHIRQTRQP